MAHPPAAFHGLRPRNLDRLRPNDAQMGPTTPHSTVLTSAEDAMVVEFRRRTLLPLDDVRRSF